jgi:hypothetical protein
MSEVRLEAFNAGMTAEAARMLARAFVTNPLHVAAFGAGELVRDSRADSLGPCPSLSVVRSREAQGDAGE